MIPARSASMEYSMLPPMHDISRQQTANCPVLIGDPPIHASKRHQKSRGQSIAEFAILLPTLVMILAVAADFGRALTAYIAISSGAREGAAYGMQSTVQATDVDGIEAAVRADIGSGGSIWGTDVGINVPALANDAQGYKQVEVTVSYSFAPFIPIPGLPSTFDLDRTVKMRVLN